MYWKLINLIIIMNRYLRKYFVHEKNKEREDRISRGAQLVFLYICRYLLAYYMIAAMDVRCAVHSIYSSSFTLSFLPQAMCIGIESAKY